MRNPAGPSAVERYGDKDKCLGKLFHRRLRKGYYRILFVNGGEYFPLKVKSIIKRQSSSWTPASSSKFELVAFLDNILIVTTGIVTQK